VQEIVKKAKKILIAADKNADFDKICACINLARAFQDSGKNISLLLPDNKYSQKIINIFPTQDVKLIHKQEPENFIVSLPKNDAVVKNVKWKEEKGSINIFVTTDKGELKQNQVTIRPNYALFDLIILVGIEKFSDLGEFYTKNPRAFPKSRIIQIGKKGRKLGAYDYEEKSISMSELVFKFLEFLKTKFDGEIATNLLAGVLWKTDGLSRIQSSGIVHTISKLVKTGANIKKSSKTAFRTISFQDTRLISQILKNIEMSDNRVVYSIIKNSSKKGLRPQEIIASSWTLLDRLEKTDVGIILIEKQTGVFGAIVADATKFNAQDIAKEYDSQGNEFMATFETKESVEQIKTKLKITKTTTTKPAKKPEKPEPESKGEEQEPLQEPLKAATKTPEPLQINGEDSSSPVPTTTPQIPAQPAAGPAPATGGFSPPPPINPLPSTSDDI